MTPKLTDEMRQALGQTAGQPVRIEDEQTHLFYVLLPWPVYERVLAWMRDEPFEVADTYAAQSAAARTSGWDDPEMDVYNDYDAGRATT